MRLRLDKGEGPRLYKRGAALYPSVTEVLKVIQKNYLNKWRHEVGELEAGRVTANAKLFGTKVHSLAQKIALGTAGEVEEGLKPYAAAIEAFLEDHVEEVLATELELVSEKHRFGGTADLYARMKDGTHGVIDFKTSRTLCQEHNAQVAAYAILLKENGYPINRRILVRLRKDKPGAMQVRHCAEHKEDVELFLSCNRLWHALNRRKLLKLQDGKTA